MVVVENLRRSFGAIRAVDGVSFEAERGDVLGILGPNGAGKSTAMRMLTCFLEPDGGRAEVRGHDIAREPVAVRRSIGYLAENAPLYDEMTVASFLRFVCDARGVPRSQRREAVERMARTCAIEPVLHQSVGTLSKGYRRRVALAGALIHDPPVLILDEPTDGLDPNQKHDVRKLIRKMARDKCIIVSTHILEEVEAVCSRVIIMARGKILVDSTPEKLKQGHDAELDEVFRRVTTEAAAGGRA
jgi:ABC-2 type transport system ATP-binding protein